MRRMWIGTALATGFVAVTWLALESQEVAVLRTRAPDGALSTTRVWLARHDGAVWIEAATPERGWYRNILDDPQVELALGDQTRRYRASPVAQPGGHERIRSLLRQKYGWADVWVGLLQDTSRSLAVRLEGVDETAQ